MLPVLLEDCEELFDRYEETKGLGDVFYVALHRDTLVGMKVSDDQQRDRIVESAAAVDQPPEVARNVYVSYANSQAELATSLAGKLETAQLKPWIATRNCRVGENWRQAQARGLLGARAQVLILGEDMDEGSVLRTELMLGEALELPLFSVSPEGIPALTGRSLATFLSSLAETHATYRRVADSQAVSSDRRSFSGLAKRLRELMAGRTWGRRGTRE